MTLKRRILKASSWNLVGQITSQVLRLGGNLILTRLLFPEAFGLMAIVQSVMTGLALISDIGISPSIVQHRRGHDPVFLDTAWTIQVLRGFVICFAVILSARWLADFYGQPDLVGLLSVAGLTAAIGGFNSTKLYLAERNIAAGKLVSIEVGAYALGLLVTIVWAYLSRSVWALVWGNVITAALKALASHVFIQGPNNGFRMDPSVARDVLSFGKWILVSSILTFFVGEGNRLVIAAFVPVAAVSFYTLANTMKRSVLQLITLVGGRVMFAAYSEIERERPRDLYRVLRKSRIYLLAPCWLGSLFFVCAGRPLMELMYDSRYADSGWMLQILSMGSLAWSVWASYEGVLMAKADLRSLTVLLVLESIIQLTGIALGGYWYGVKGIVAAVALSNWLLYPFVAWVYARHAVWQPEIDLPFLAGSAAVIAFVLL